ncbi:MAG: radical SAM protein [Oscillospiraceae bacterium]|nr:radical SAM protein [Oscillospiraceae bacterium]
MHFIEAKGILTGKGDAWGMNVYRGCTHGCIYCDSRSLCYRLAQPFEDIEVKRNAPELLEKALRARRRRCMIGTGSMSDPYNPCEKELGLTRRCLEIIRRYGFGATVLTKSDLILRDIGLLEAIGRESRCVVQMTLTTWDETLCTLVEPGVCGTARRLEVLRELRGRGIPTIVWLSPLLPYLNDTEENLRPLLEGCAEAGVKGIVCFGMGMTLREGSREHYYAALDRHFPGLKERYIRRYGEAYELESPNAPALRRLFEGFCREHGMLYTPEDCFRFLAEFPDRDEQLSLF